MKAKIKTLAVELRKQGCSLLEISNQCGVSKSTASIWLRNVVMSAKHKKALLVRNNNNWRAAVKKRQYLRGIERDLLDKLVSKYIDKRTDIADYYLLICAMLYWCEGEKSLNGVRFVNSDPMMVKVFMNLFRKSFQIDESRLRACLHLHSYHDELTQKHFWSNITNIPVGQFYKIYWKESGGKRKHLDYQGCLSVRYGDNKVLHKLLATAQIFGKKIGG